MTFCTLVEFEWDETFGRERFARVIGEVGGDTPEGVRSGDPPRPGSLSSPTVLGVF